MFIIFNKNKWFLDYCKNSAMTEDRFRNEVWVEKWSGMDKGGKSGHIITFVIYNMYMYGLLYKKHSI